MRKWFNITLIALIVIVEALILSVWYINDYYLTNKFNFHWIVYVAIIMLFASFTDWLCEKNKNKTIGALSVIGIGIIDVIAISFFTGVDSYLKLYKDFKLSLGKVLAVNFASSISSAGFTRYLALLVVFIFVFLLFYVKIIDFKSNKKRRK